MTMRLGNSLTSPILAVAVLSFLADSSSAKVAKVFPDPAIDMDRAVTTGKQTAVLAGG